MFVGRVDPFKKTNEDFTMEDMKPDSSWLKDAVNQNMTKQ